MHDVLTIEVNEASIILGGRSCRSKPDRASAIIDDLTVHGLEA